jgi:hypothetical protein
MYSGTDKSNNFDYVETYNSGGNVDAVIGSNHNGDGVGGFAGSVGGPSSKPTSSYVACTTLQSSARSTLARKNKNAIATNSSRNVNNGYGNGAATNNYEYDDDGVGGGVGDDYEDEERESDVKRLEDEFDYTQTSLKYHTFKSDSYELRLYCYVRHGGKTYYELKPLIECLKLSNTKNIAEQIMPSDWIYKAREFKDPKFKKMDVDKNAEFILRSGVYYLLNESKSTKMKAFVTNMYETCFREIENNRIIQLNQRIMKVLSVIHKFEDTLNELRKEVKLMRLSKI